MTDYGRDTYCLDVLRTGRYASGATLVAQRVYHRFITPRYPASGSLIGGEDERNFGLDLAEMVGQAHTPELINALPQRIRNEAAKDHEVDATSVRVTVEPFEDGGEYTYEITITARAAGGPFELVLGVSDVTVDLLRVDT